MSAAETNVTSVGGLTDRLASFVHGIRWEELDLITRRAAHRHLLDTLGVMISGSQQRVTTQAEVVLAGIRPAGAVPVPGRARRADLLDAAYLGAAAGHGLEFDDGYRQGSTHPGTVVVPAALAVGYQMGASGRALLEAVVAGYEAQITIARIAHPAMRRQGFHPTATSGVFGAAVAAARLRGVSLEVLQRAVGIAASSAAGLFAFVSGGADIKRLHPAHAAREGVLAVLLAEQGVAGPPGVLEGRDGFLQAFAAGAQVIDIDAELPPQRSYGISECYIKPYPCCRHLHPSIDALLALLDQHGLTTKEIERVEVETYHIAAEHAAVGWDDFASSQLSFCFVIATALRYRAVGLEHFEDAARADVATTGLCRRIEVRGSETMDERYKTQRPAHVRLHAQGEVFEYDASEALGSPENPLDDAGCEAKFLTLTAPVLGEVRAQALRQQWQTVDTVADVAPLVAAAAHNNSLTR